MKAAASPETHRPPAVAGLFYPADAAALGRAVADYLAGVATEAPAPKAVIVPHAGFVYSAPVAARAYAALAKARGVVTRVVLLGPAHRVAFRALALPDTDAFETPLGAVPIDRDAAAALARLSQVRLSDQAHRDEHALEVQLPFLQWVLGDFALVPLLVGDATPAEVAEVIDTLWDGPETVIVVSSDLSHYLDYASARQLDARTARAIEGLRPDDIGPDQACGRLPIQGLLRVAKARGLGVTTVDLRNSGDTAGPRDQVVGYGAWLLA